MNNNRSTIIGWILIAAVMVGFIWINQPTEEQLAEQARLRAAQDSIALVQAQQELDQSMAEARYNQILLQDSTSALFLAAQGEEQTFTLENEVVRLTFSNRGARVTSAILKEYTNQEGLPLELFNQDDESINFMLDGKNENIVTEKLYFEPVEVTENTLVFRMPVGTGHLDFSYRLLPESYMLNFTVQAHGLQNFFPSSMKTMNVDWAQRVRQQEKGYTFEQRYTTLTYRTEKDTEHLSEMKEQSKELAGVEWIAFKDQFFSSIFIADQQFKSANIKSSPINEGSGYLKNMEAETTVFFDPSGEKASQFQFYFGPNQYQTLKESSKLSTSGKNLHLDKLIYFGWPIVRWVNRFFVVYLFDWLNSWGINMGIVLLLLTLIVKAIVFPFTYKQYVSTAKMRSLKPYIDKINAKYPNPEDALQKQQETMQLYSKYGVSPMSGCLPTLIQMPVWMALFFFIPNAIELRGQKFLWANDLSAYDDLLHWNFNLPLLGDHISLFCLLFSIVNIVNTLYTMKQQPAGGDPQQQKMMKWMMLMMPIIFIFALNNYSAGLNYYYFISTLTTIIIMFVLRKTIDENKLLVQLEANYAKNQQKPVKKSSMMARLEAMQQQLEEQQKLQQQQQRNNTKK
ncbi:MAG: membrane protein insertase YidC [Bacteroidaceae bacterium]|nr:membrane protein insertase YidC [Bacteroidaceae bacterium]